MRLSCNPKPLATCLDQSLTHSLVGPVKLVRGLDTSAILYGYRYNTKHGEVVVIDPVSYDHRISCGHNRLKYRAHVHCTYVNSLLSTGFCAIYL